MLLLGSCKKFVETPLPTNQLSSQTVLDQDKTLLAALNGVYGILNNNTNSTYYYPAYFSDELTNSTAIRQALDAQGNTYNAEQDFNFFSGYYSAIYNANAIIEAIANPGPDLTAPVMRRAKGEALFLRAYCYFHLINYYGNVPLIHSTDVRITALTGNTPASETYKSIISDLLESVQLLEETYTSTYRTHVNKQAANAFLSKVYLYNHDWNKAVLSADEVIKSPLYALNTNLNTTFLAGSTETIWQLWNINGFSSVSSGYVPANTTVVNYRVRPTLLNAFEDADQRKTAWIKAGTGVSASAYYPYKYRLRVATTGNNAEYYIQLRLGDILLVRAEALAHLEELDKATDDLYAIRKRAGLINPITFNNSSELLTAIVAERRKELMFENANRWFDLKRTGQAKAVLSTLKQGFLERALLLPIPNTIIANNPNLVQNQDY